MDIESFTTELNSRMNGFIQSETSQLPQDPALRATTLNRFGSQLKSTVNSLLEERKIVFNHDVELSNFVSQLNAPVQDLLNKYISG